MRTNRWILPVVLCFGCKPQPAAPSKSPTPAVSGEASLTVTSEPDGPERGLLETVAKRLMGLSAKADEKQDHIGLINLAAMFGYDLPFNECGSPWQVSTLGEGAGVTLIVTSNHAIGKGSACGEPNPDAPVKYLFKNWVIRSSEVTSQETGQPSPKTAPLPTGESNAQQTAAPRPVASGSNLTWSTDESLRTSLSTLGGTEGRLQLTYERQLAAEPQWSVRSASAARSNEVHLAVAKGSRGFLDFNLSSAVSDHVPAMLRMQCVVDVGVPAGCVYHGTLTARFEQLQTRYQARLQLQPLMVGFKGRLTSRGACAHMALRSADGSCSGAMGDDGKGVESWFGRSNGAPAFAQDLTAQAAATQGGVWDFAAMRTNTTQQNQGIPNLDWVLRYLQDGEFSKVVVTLSEVQEKLSSCTLHIDVDPTSTGNCVRNVPDRIIEPSAF